MKNLGNVAMDTCSLCNKPYQILLQSREGKDIFDGRKTVCSGGICSSCEEALKKNVSFLCITCNSFHTIKFKAIKNVLPSVKKGERYKTFECPNCNSKEAFVWHPPKV